MIISVQNRNDFCPEVVNYSTVFFFNVDLDENRFDLELIDGDNDTCQMELINFRDVFRLEQVERNHYRFFALRSLDREYYLLQFRLYDLIENANDHSCIRTIESLLTTGNNETNETMAIEHARDYFLALQAIGRRSSSSFHWSLFHLILLFIFFLLALLIGLFAMKFFCSLSKRSDQLYRYQGQRETQLPLLDDEQQVKD